MLCCRAHCSVQAVPQRVVWFGYCCGVRGRCTGGVLARVVFMCSSRLCPTDRGLGQHCPAGSSDRIPALCLQAGRYMRCCRQAHEVCCKVETANSSHRRPCCCTHHAVGNVFGIACPGEQQWWSHNLSTAQIQCVSQLCLRSSCLCRAGCV